jgi:hypothetical protein
LAVFESLVQVALLQVGGGKDGHPQANGPGEVAGGHGDGAAVPAQGCIRAAQVTVDFHGVGGHAGRCVVADPCRFVAGGFGLFEVVF